MEKGKKKKEEEEEKHTLQRWIQFHSGYISLIRIVSFKNEAIKPTTRSVCYNISMVSSAPVCVYIIDANWQLKALDNITYNKKCKHVGPAAFW